jgi:fluoride exporter
MSFVELWLAVGVLGGLGAVARFLLYSVISDGGVRIPLGTLAVNLSGTFALGVLAGAALRGDGYLLAGTATLGAYTTFSTWMLESERSRGHGRAVLVANVLISLLLGLVAVALGRLLGEAL